MDFDFQISQLASCPYLTDREFMSAFFYADRLNGDIYEELLGQGWRRSGCLFYRNNCPDCNECRPIRIDLVKFMIAGNQRRTMKKNDDIHMELSLLEFREEDYSLYRKYYEKWHKTEKVPELSEYLFFLDSPLETKIIRYYLKKKMVGISWIDILPSGLSSVYFAFDPDYHKRRLGIYSLLKEIEIAVEMGKKWLYLGFYIKDCLKMSYKAEFKPYQIALNGKWLNNTDFKIKKGHE